MSGDRGRIVGVAAPVAFLLAVTITVLVVRAGLREGDAVTPGPAATSIRSGPATVVVRAGDTLDAIARRSGTTVEALERLNPGIDPTGLRVGQRVRVSAG